MHTTGNFRAAKFVKYFNEFGIDPVVLCGTEESIQQYYKNSKVNLSLLSDIPENCEIYRVPFDRPYSAGHKYNQIKYYADPIYSFWKKNALNTAKLILSKYPEIKLILVSLPPFSVGELAYRVSKLSGLPLFVDLRDAWSFQGQFPYFTRLHYFANLLMERRLLKHATKIITVTHKLAEIYLKSNRNLNPNKITVVYNGYDSLRIDKNETIISNPVSDVVRYIIGYIGSFYFDYETEKIRKTVWWKRKISRMLFYFAAKEEWIYRSPYFFFKILSNLFIMHPFLRKKVFFGYIGETPSWLNEMAAKFGLDQNLLTYGFIKSDELPEIVEAFSAFLGTSEKIEGNKSFCLPSKTFEYLQYRKPIIGLVKEGDYSTFLENTKVGIVMDPDDIPHSVKCLEKFLFNENIFLPDINYIKRFHIKEQVRKLASILNEKN